MKRRTYVLTATTATFALAGCLGTETDDEPETDETDSDDDTADDRSDDQDDAAAEETDDETTEDEVVTELAGTFDGFETLEPWSAVIGSIEADTDRSYEGTQSALLTPNEDDGQVRVRRELEEPIDVTDAVPGLAMATDNPGTVLIQLQDSEGDYVEYSQQVLESMPLVRTNFGLTRVRGEPDLADIRLVQLIRWFGEDDDNGNDDNSDGELWVDDLHFVPKPETGVIQLQFHGGYETHYTEALERVGEYPATTFVPTSRIRTDEIAEGNRLTQNQLDELADAGWTIGSYGARGLQLDELDPSEQETDVLEPIEWLSEQGYEDDARFFAFPGARYDESSYTLVQEHYDLAFAGRTPAQGYASNPHRFSFVSSPDADEAVSLLEWTAEWRGITSLAFFRLEESEVLEALEATVERLDELTDAGELEVVTPGEVLDEYVF